MFAEQASDSLSRRRHVAQTALTQMTRWLAQGYELQGMNLPAEAHVSVAMGFAVAIRVNGLLDVLESGPGAAMSMVAAVLSGPCTKATPHSEVVLAYDTVVAGAGINPSCALSDDSTDVRLFWWRLNKLTRRLGSREIVWDDHLSDAGYRR